MLQQKSMGHGRRLSLGRHTIGPLLVSMVAWWLQQLPPACAQRDDARVEHQEHATAVDEAGAARQTAAALYQQYCQRCHAAGGTGHRARPHLPEIPDFTRGHWQQQRTDVALRVSILEGRGTRMPAFSGRVSPAQADELVKLIRALGPRQPLRTAVSIEEFERRYEALQRELESLQRQFRRLSSRRPRTALDEAP